MTDQPNFWLVNSGTSSDPWLSRPVSRYREWVAVNGDAQFFSSKPKNVRVGDFLIHRAVGSKSDSLIAAGVVVGIPEDRGYSSWRWRLPRRLLFVCPSLDAAPAAETLGITASGMRTFKALERDVGARAFSAIAEVGEPWED